MTAWLPVNYGIACHDGPTGRMVHVGDQLYDARECPTCGRPWLLWHVENAIAGPPTGWRERRCENATSPVYAIGRVWPLGHA